MACTGDAKTGVSLQLHAKQSLFTSIVNPWRYAHTHTYILPGSHWQKSPQLGTGLSLAAIESRGNAIDKNHKRLHGYSVGYQLLFTIIFYNAHQITFLHFSSISLRYISGITTLLAHQAMHPRACAGLAKWWSLGLSLFYQHKREQVGFKRLPGGSSEPFSCP